MYLLFNAIFNYFGILLFIGFKESKLNQSSAPLDEIKTNEILLKKIKKKLEQIRYDRVTREV